MGTEDKVLMDTNVFTEIVENIRGAAAYCTLSEDPLQRLDAWEGISAGRKMNEILKQFYKTTELYRSEASESLPRALLTLRDGMIAVDKEASENLTVEKVTASGGGKLEQKR